MTRRHPVPEVEGVLTAREVMATVEHIAAVQLPSGNIPWFPGHHTDPWNMVEAAMALDAGSRPRAARRAYEWLCGRQRADGAWNARYMHDTVIDDALDTNFTAYVGTGLWHHFLCTGSHDFLRDTWPAVERAIDFVLAQQSPTGEITWLGNRPDSGALLTGCSSIHGSLRCALAIAETVGAPRPDWELSVGALAIAIAHRPERFMDKSRFSMDWYYPVLGGVLRGTPAHARIAAGWSTFVVEGRGVRCVSDRPWVTAAETCETVLALEAIGAHDLAHRLFAAVQFLRTDDGGYWTGMNFEGERFDDDGELFPVEQPSWTNAAVVLAANALCGRTTPAALFRGDGLPAGLSPAELIEAGVQIEQERSTGAPDRSRRF